MGKMRVIVLSDKAAAFANTPAPMPVVEDIYAISDKRAWVVVVTDFAQETKAKTELEKANVATYLPLERAYVRKVQVRSTMVAGMIRRTRQKTIRRPVERPLFPGYLFAQVPLLLREEHATRPRISIEATTVLKDADGVAGILGTEAGPLPIPNEFVSILSSQQGDGAFDRTTRKNSAWADEGMRVSIADGPFAGFLGIVEQCLPKDIFKVAVEIFGRPTLVTLDLAQMEKAC